MKASARDIDSELRKLNPRYLAVLVYGPNEGLVRERADAFGKQVVQDLKDPFNVAILTAQDITADPARLADEAAAMSMLGGRRLVRVDPATDAILPSLEAVLTDPKGDSLIVLVAGDLSPRSGLRKFVEGAANALAVACYDDDARSLEDLLRSSLQAHNLRIDQVAARHLLERIGNDRMVARGEIEKLALYKLNDENRTISASEVEAIIGDSASLALDDVSNATTDGDLVRLDHALHKAFIQGETAVSILRAVARRLLRLYEAAGYMREGLRADEAVKRLKPPVFFKDVPGFTSQLNRWNAERLVAAIKIVTDAETEAKSSTFPSETVCARACLRIANAARLNR